MSRRKNISKVDGKTLQFLDHAYGYKGRHINSYHIKLTIPDYDGWFDWYHTTGTLIANRDGGTSNLGKIKDAKELALKITKHIYGR